MQRAVEEEWTDSKNKDELQKMIQRARKTREAIQQLEEEYRVDVPGIALLGKYEVFAARTRDIFPEKDIRDVVFCELKKIRDDVFYGFKDAEELQCTY